MEGERLYGNSCAFVCGLYLQWVACPGIRMRNLFRETYDGASLEVCGAFWGARMKEIASGVRIC